MLLHFCIKFFKKLIPFKFKILIGRAVMKFPVFAKAIQRCDSVLRPYGVLLTDILTSDNKTIFDNIINLILGLVGLQVRRKTLPSKGCKYNLI